MKPVNPKGVCSCGRNDIVYVRGSECICTRCKEFESRMSTFTAHPRERRTSGLPVYKIHMRGFHT